MKDGSLSVNTKGLRRETMSQNKTAISNLSKAREQFATKIEMPEKFVYSSLLNNIPERIKKVEGTVSEINSYIDRKADDFEKAEKEAERLASKLTTNMLNNPDYLYYMMTQGANKQNSNSLFPYSDASLEQKYAELMAQQRRTNANVVNLFKSAFQVTAYADTTSDATSINANKILTSLEKYIKDNGLSAQQGACYDDENDSLVVTVNRKDGSDKDAGGNMLWIDTESGNIIYEISLENLEELNKDANGNYDGKAIERLKHIEGIAYNSDKGCIVLKDYIKEENSLFEIKLDSKSGEVNASRVGNKRYYRQLAYIPSEVNENGESEPGHLVGINQSDEEYDKVNKPPTLNYLKWDESKNSYVPDIEYAKKVSNNQYQIDEVVRLTLKQGKEKFNNIQGMAYNGGHVYLSESWPNDDENENNFRLWKYKLNGELDKEYKIDEGFQFREIENIVFKPDGNAMPIMPYEIAEASNIKGVKSILGDSIRAKRSPNNKKSEKTHSKNEVENIVNKIEK